MKSTQPQDSTAVSSTLRQQREALFHDKWAQSLGVDDIVVREAFESPTATENQFVLSSFGDIKGKRILDLGCGMGDAAVYFAAKGAIVYAIDVSAGMIDLTRHLAEEFGVSVHPEQMPAEALRFDDASFDFVYGNGVLHHVDFLQATREVYRVLRPGGSAAFIEPLCYSPAIWGYRALAGSVRTEDERPLSAKSVETICSGGRQSNRDGGQWRKATHREFHMFTSLIMAWFLIGEGILPSQERYWKRFVQQGYRYRVAFDVLNAMDCFFFRVLPISRWLSWNTVIVLQK